MRTAGVVFLAALVVFGCSGDKRNPFLDTNSPGSGFTAGGSDATPIENQPRTTLSGTICEIVDLRTPTTCVDNRANVAVVTEYDEASSDSNGSFTLGIPGNPTSVDLRMTDSADLLRPTVVRVELPSEGPYPDETVAMIDGDLMSSYEAQLGEGPSDNVATLMVYVERDGAPLSGAVLQQAPAGTLGGTYYDIAEEPFLGLAASTGPYGVIALFGVPAGGEVQLRITPAVGEAIQTVTMPTIEGGLTFTTAELPAP